MQLGGLPPPEGLTEDQMRRIVEAKGQLIEWLDSVEAHVFARLTDGKEFPGFKLVEGRANRHRKDGQQDEHHERRNVGLQACHRHRHRQHVQRRQMGEVNGIGRIP